jgi:hypothetical protein
MKWLALRRGANSAAERRSLTLKLIMDGNAVPVLKAYVENFDELGALPQHDEN